MKGWLLVARISCSARALLILFRLIISFLLNTERVLVSANGQSNEGTRAARTFHGIQPAALLLLDKINLADISLANQLYLVETLGANLDIADLDRVATVCSPKCERRPARGRERPKTVGFRHSKRIVVT